MANPASNVFQLDQYIIHHVSNSQEWKLPFLPPIPLPHPLSLHGLAVILASGFLIYLFCFVYDRRRIVPRGITNFLESVVIFIRDEISIPALGEEDGREKAPFFCTLFFFILTLNVMGLIPIFPAATSNYSVTGALALVILTIMLGGAIYKNGFKGFIKSLAPSGIPIFVLPLVMLIEFMGLFIKSFALTVRLFANLLAGHIIILALLGLVALLGVYLLPIVFLAVFIYCLEVLVCLVQAYIFTLLSAIFIGLTHHPEH